MSRKSKIILTVLLISVLAFSPRLIFAAITRTDEAEAALLQEGNITNEIILYEEAVSQFAGQNAQTIEEYIYYKLLDCEESINLQSFRLPKDDIMPLYSAIINRHPDLFYVSSSLSYRYFVVGNENYCYDIQPEYSMTASEILNAKTIFNNGVNKALSQINEDMSDIQKALRIHDYLCDITTYATDADYNDKPIYHSAYGIMYDGNAVCAGYALTYSYIMQQLNIPCEYVLSHSMAHAWNAIQIDDKWYNVDLTWDDVSYGNKNIRGAMNHNCFLKSNTALYGEKGNYHFDGITADNLDLTDTTYDEYFWDDICTNIYSLNGDYYYIANSESTLGFFKQTPQGDVSRVYSGNLSFVYYTINSVFTDGNGVEHTVTHIDYHPRLLYINGTFFINSRDRIYSITTGGSRIIRVMNLPTYVIALGYNETDIVYQYRDSATSDEIAVHMEAGLVDRAASCSLDGYTGRTICEICHDIINEGVVTEAYGHNYKFSEYTQTRDLLFICNDCSESFIADSDELNGYWNSNLINRTDIPRYKGNDKYINLLDTNSDGIINAKDYAVIHRATN